MKHSFHPYPIVAATKLLLFAVILSIVLFFFRDFFGGFFQLIIAILWLWILLRVLLAFLRAKFHTIFLDDHSVTYQSGIIARKRIVLPYARITEASYTQGIMQRLFAVGTLKLDSAGGSLIAIHVPDIRQKELQNILLEVNKKAGKQEDGL